MKMPSEKKCEEKNKEETNATERLFHDSWDLLKCPHSRKPHKPN